MNQSKQQLKASRLLYFENKLHNSSIFIRNKFNHYLGSCQCTDDTNDNEQLFWIVNHCKDFENWNILCSMNNNQLEIDLQSFHKQYIVNDKNNNLTLLNDLNENENWILEFCDNNESIIHEDRITWYPFYIKNKKNNNYISSNEQIFPNSLIELNNKPYLWYIGVSRITIIVIGGGNRGYTYARYAGENPSLVRCVGLIDPKEYRKCVFSNHVNIGKQINSKYMLNDWRELICLGRIVDAVIIATPDRLHAEIAINCAQLGYHILLEKPMATTEQDCRDIVSCVKKNKCIFAVCHVLRYTPYSRKVKELIDNELIGDIINIQHLEPVGFYHFAHSYVRGNWRNTKDSSFSLLTKSCHDLDWLRWIIGKKCIQTSSFGSLNHFKKEKKPENAGMRCMDCKVEKTCPYSAKAIYLELVKMGYDGWPVDVIVDCEPNVESVTKALENGPYGRCVYECDNDVVDNQVVNLQFNDGITASFSMIAFTKELCIRKTKIFGSKGELECDGEDIINHFDFLTQKSRIYHPDPIENIKTSLTNHGYGDYYIIKDFVNAVAYNDQSFILSGPDEALESHLMVFAAEKSRLEKKVISIE